MSRLLKNSEGFRKREFARNTSTLSTPDNEYNVGHPNAKSDGDEKGKGENNDSIGGLTDITKREQSATRNMYNNNRPYDASRA